MSVPFAAILIAFRSEMTVQVRLALCVSAAIMLVACHGDGLAGGELVQPYLVEKP